MGKLKWVFLIIGILFVSWTIFNFKLWAGEFMDSFFYQDDWISYIAVFAFVFAVAGILKWVLNQQVKAIEPKKRWPKR
jgi:hypothetical protein